MFSRSTPVMMDPNSMADPLGAAKGCTVAVTAIVVYLSVFSFPSSLIQSSRVPRLVEREKSGGRGIIRDFIDVRSSASLGGRRRPLGGLRCFTDIGGQCDWSI